MGTIEKIKHELVSVIVLTLYFLVWISFLMLLKYLLLAHYAVGTLDMSKAVIGALVLAKVVLVLEYVPFGKRVRAQAAWVDVVLRTAFYTAGVFVVMVLEKAFESRREADGFMQAVVVLFHDVAIYHLLLSLICVSAALLSYNIISVLHKNLGKGVMLRMLRSPLPDKPIDFLR